MLNAGIFPVALYCMADLLPGGLQEEETTLLPQLAAVLNAETQLQLGIHFEAAKVSSWSLRASKVFSLKSRVAHTTAEDQPCGTASCMHCCQLHTLPTVLHLPDAAGQGLYVEAAAGF